MIHITGFMAAIMTTSTFIPQVIKTIRLKSTKDLSYLMIIFQVIGSLLWSIYGYFIHSSAVLFSNLIIMSLVFTLLLSKCYFDN